MASNKTDGFQSRKPRMRVTVPQEIFFRIPEPEECELNFKDLEDDYGDHEASQSQQDFSGFDGIKGCGSCELMDEDDYADISVSSDHQDHDHEHEESYQLDDDDDDSQFDYDDSFCRPSPPRSAAYFDCKLCRKMAREPVVTSCGHLYCGDCLDQWLHFFTSQMECPVCHSKVSDSLITRIRPTPVCNKDLNSGLFDVQPPRQKRGLCF